MPFDVQISLWFHVEPRGLSCTELICIFMYLIGSQSIDANIQWNWKQLLCWFNKPKSHYKMVSVEAMLQFLLAIDDTAFSNSKNLAHDGAWTDRPAAP